MFTMDTKQLSSILGFDLPENCQVEINIKLPDGELSDKQVENVTGGGLGRAQYSRWGTVSLDYKRGTLKNFDTAGKLHDIKLAGGLVSGSDVA
jgi:hypothetical protein